MQHSELGYSRSNLHLYFNSNDVSYLFGEEYVVYYMFLLTSCYIKMVKTFPKYPSFKIFSQLK